jgi:hypothetical protein
VAVFSGGVLGQAELEHGRFYSSLS